MTLTPLQYYLFHDLRDQTATLALNHPLSLPAILELIDPVSDAVDHNVGLTINLALEDAC